MKHTLSLFPNESQLFLKPYVPWHKILKPRELDQMHALPPFSNESAKTECRSAQKLKALVNLITIHIHV